MIGGMTLQEEDRHRVAAGDGRVAGLRGRRVRRRLGHCYPLDNTVLGAGTVVMVALAPMLFSAGLVFAAVSLSKRNAATAVVGIATVMLGFGGAAAVGASTLVN